jgi:hypothetical protein
MFYRFPPLGARYDEINFRVYSNTVASVNHPTGRVRKNLRTSAKVDRQKMDKTHIKIRKNRTGKFLECNGSILRWLSSKEKTKQTVVVFFWLFFAYQSHHVHIRWQL